MLVEPHPYAGRAGWVTGDDLGDMRAFEITDWDETVSFPVAGSRGGRRSACASCC